MNATIDREAVEAYGRTISAVMDWPPIPGRLAMTLMMTGEPLTIAELRDFLDVSTGSLSESTRLLITAGVIERVKIAGQRQQVFRWRQDAWVGCVQHQAAQIATIRQVAQDAVANPNLTPVQLASFQQMLDFYTVLSAALDNIAAVIEKTFLETGQYLDRSVEGRMAPSPSDRNTERPEDAGETPHSTRIAAESMIAMPETSSV